MPNGTFAKGSPVANALKGFDRPNELFCVVDSQNEPFYFGYMSMCEFFVESKALNSEIKRLNAETGKPFDYVMN